MINWRTDIENAPRNGNAFLGLFEHNTGHSRTISTLRAPYEPDSYASWWVVDSVFSSPIIETHPEFKEGWILIKWSECNVD